MGSKHTPEPWVVGSRNGIVATVSIYAPGSDWRVALTEWGPTYAQERPTHEANAARIVACVNACAGINPEAVPDLLAFVRDVVSTGDDYDSGALDFEAASRRLCALSDRARAAIARAEGR